jgi:hypothetical protein
MQEISEQSKLRLSHSTALHYLIVLLAAGALYLLTCAPTILWQDSALFVYRIWHNDIQGNLGIALAHPLYVMIGILFKFVPVGQLAWRINLISAIFGALAVANLFLLLKLWLGNILPAVIGAVTLAVSWTFWQHAVIAEAYSLYAAQLFAELIVLLLYVRTKHVKYLYLLGLLNGLAIANHLWAVFGFICYAIFLVFLLAKKQVHFKHFGVIVLLWLIGAAPYEYLIIKEIVVTGNVPATLASALFGNGWQSSVLNASITGKIVFENVIFIALNFPTPNFLLLFVGLWALYKTAPSRSYANIIVAMLVLHFVFAFRYTVPDRHAFFLPFYCLAAIFVGLGADALFRRINHNVLVFAVLVFAMMPAAVYTITPEVGRKMYKPLGQRRKLPYRDNYKYFLQPWKNGERSAEKFAHEALDSVDENAIIYADTTTAHALLYAQEVEGLRHDVRIISDYDSSENAPVFNEETIEDLVQNFPVYVVSPLKRYCPAFLLNNFGFVETGTLWRVVGRK